MFTYRQSRPLLFWDFQETVRTSLTTSLSAATDRVSSLEQSLASARQETVGMPAPASVIVTPFCLPAYHRGRNYFFCNFQETVRTSLTTSLSAATGRVSSVEESLASARRETVGIVCTSQCDREPPFVYLQTIAAVTIFSVISRRLFGRSLPRRCQQLRAVCRRWRSRWHLHDRKRFEEPA